MTETHEERVIRQIDRENQSVVDGRANFWKGLAADKQMRGEGNPLLCVAERKAIASHVTVFAQAIAAAFPTDPIQFSKLHRGWPAEFKARLVQLFSKVSPAEAAFAVLKYAIKNMFVNEQKNNYARICIPAADEIIRQYHFKTFEEAEPHYVRVLVADLKTRHEGHLHRVLTGKRREHGVPDFEMGDREKMILGGLLVHMLVATTGLFAFTEKMDYAKRYLTMVLVATPKFADWLEEQHDLYAELQPVDVPMIVEPKPWTSSFDGGFLTNNERRRTHSILRQRHKDLRKTGYDRASDTVLRGISALQAVAWAINVPVLETLEQVRRTGSGLGGVPDVPKENRLPPKPWSGLGMDKDAFKQAHPDQFQDWRRKNAIAQTQFYNESSARTTFSVQVAVAREFADEQEFYFCYNMDWRGRVYSLQNCGLNPQGDDMSKALLRFAKATPLGERGLYWLGVHLANSFGFDKAPFDERHKWTLDHHSDILGAAGDPFGCKWWAEGDKPYCLLAACFEWAAAHQLYDPTTYMSTLPISMDASCSGSQHFSGLLRDPIGGKAVNLLPSDRPSDIYDLVAKQSMKIMAKEGTPEGQAWLDIEGGFNRKWTKRNTMTMPYSASLYGFTNQLKEDIHKESKKHGKPVLPTPRGKKQSNWDFECARYLAVVNRVAISRVVVKMFDAMEWFRETAAVVAKAGQDIRWETPVGLKVIQRYKKSDSKILNLWFGSLRYQSHITTEKNVPNINGHKNGISPNFIHSMDAAHLIRVSNEFVGVHGRSLGVVHDSFSTHACDVDLLRDVVRREFVAIYKDTNILKSFYKTLRADNPGLKIKRPPKQGAMDINDVLRSDYFVS